jgi:hypothetical protein
MLSTIRIRRQEKRQIMFYKAIAVPTLTYGSEIWSITKNKKLWEELIAYFP